MVKQLSKHVEDSNAPIGGDLPLLFLAVAKNQRAVVTWLVREGGADVNFLLQTEGADMTALVIACQFNLPNMVQLLIDEGADIRVAAPLSFCAARPALDGITRILIEAGANVNSAPPRDTPSPLLISITGILRRDEGGALLNVRGNGSIGVTRLLIAAGVDVDRPCVLGGQPLFALIACAEMGKADVMKLLLGAGANVNAPHHGHQSPLFLACRHARVSCVRLLLRYGRADPNLRSKMTVRSLQTGTTSLQLLPSDIICQRPGTNSAAAPLIHRLLDGAERWEATRTQAMRSGAQARSQRRIRRPL